jgi:hypothetical protein
MRDALEMACRWLTDIAQVRSEKLSVEKNSVGHGHGNWRGAIRGEYRVATREWDFFCPIWHTGQAVAALVAAHRVFGNDRLVEAASLGAEFVGRERVSDSGHPHYGLIFATEDRGDVVNTSAILECCDGLIALSEYLDEPKYWDWVAQAAGWVAANAYLGQGLFRDAFSLSDWGFTDLFPGPGRPLIDDAIMLRVFKRTGDRAFRDIFYETADRLLRDEYPPGNWVNYAPCNAKAGTIHPRHAYWWGLPMIAAYEDSGDAKYLDCAMRAGEWYVNAQRGDGGLFRRTYIDFKTDSFGHATSGIACAAILWQELHRVTGDTRWLEPADKALRFCTSVQFTEPEDPNLTGAILEKVMPPDATDRSPYHIRDLGTIFFVKAACLRLLRLEAAPTAG